MEQEHLAPQPFRISYRAGFVLGIVSGLLMTLIMAALRFATSTPVLPEVIADWITRVTPPALFDFFLENLQVAAKLLMFSVLLAGQVLTGGLLGLIYVRYSSKLALLPGNSWAKVILVATGVWLVFMILVSPLLGAGFFGMSLPNGLVGFTFTTYASFLAFGFSFVEFHRIALMGLSPEPVTERREFMRRAAFFGLLATVGGLTIRTIVQGTSTVTPSTVSNTAGEMPPEITPNDQFYEVSKSIVNPRVDAADWKLELTGDFGNSMSLTYEELQSLPWQEEYVTLTCISNRIGGDLISNALWRGVRLRTLLELAEMPSEVERLAFHAADGYVDSFSTGYALRDQTMVAYMMNGEPLPHGHGFPARIIVPGLYGMENVKWLKKIETVRPSFRGYWQERGWADTAVIKTMSKIDVPDGNARVAANIESLIGGVAFAGDRGIKAVEVSFDDGETWQNAKFSRPLSPYTWVLWTIDWTPVEPQRVILAVRATDNEGGTQPAVIKRSLPDGAEGWHRIPVTVL